jgi:hypothetical protein
MQRKETNNAYKILVGKLMERNCSGNLAVNGRIILK